MKKKGISTNVVTTPVLRRELTKVKKELKQELKQELGEHIDKRIDVAERVLREEIRVSVQEAEEKLGEKLSKATDTILTHIDPFVKEVRDSHDERAIVANQIAEFRDRVDDHGERVKQLEKY